MWIVGLLLVVIIAWITMYEWWDKNQEKVGLFFSDIKVAVAKAAGYVVVEYVLQWNVIRITEREYLLAGTPEEIIDEHNEAFLKRKVPEHNLNGRSQAGEVKSYWRYL